MAVLTAQGISEVGLELLQRGLVLPRTVTMVPGDEFAGHNGDTITIRVPQPSTARKQASPGDVLVADDVTEVPQTVSMKHIYHLKDITDQEASFNLENFASQVTSKQVGAVTRGVEKELIDAMNGLSLSAIEFALSASDANTVDTMADVREVISKNEAPSDNRYIAASPEVITRLLNCSQFVKVDSAGSSDALRSAVIGRIFGFEVIEVTGLTAGTAVAYHKSGFGMTVRTPTLPNGAADAYAITAGGIGLRQVFQYDATRAKDQSLVSAFAGATAVHEDADDTVAKRFVKFAISTD